MRVEVETALVKGLPVIPILVGRTSMTKPEQLPDSLKDFAYRNALSYFALAKRYHPDRNPCGAELMANINAARAAILNSYRKSAA